MLATIWSWIDTNSAAMQTVCIVAGTGAAFLVIFHNGLISRREATIQMVDAQFGEEGDRYEKFKSLMTDIESLNQCISEYAQETSDNKEARDIILRQLNRYELISLGIKKGVFNEGFYKRWFFSQVIRDHEKLSPFVAKTREIYSNDAYFCEFDDLTNRWQRKKHPVKHPPKWKIVWWLVTGQTSRAKRALEA